jgi:hypothetical protein
MRNPALSYLLLIICSIIQYELGLLLARTIQDKQLLDKNLLLKHQIKLTILIVCFRSFCDNEAIKHNTTGGQCDG